MFVIQESKNQKEVCITLAQERGHSKKTGQKTRRDTYSHVHPPSFLFVSVVLCVSPRLCPCLSPSFPLFLSFSAFEFLIMFCHPSIFFSAPLHPSSRASVCPGSVSGLVDLTPSRPSSRLAFLACFDSLSLSFCWPAALGLVRLATLSLVCVAQGYLGGHLSCSLLLLLLLLPSPLAFTFPHRPSRQTYQRLACVCAAEKPRRRKDWKE